MIKQLLNRKFVQKNLDDLKRELSQGLQKLQAGDRETAKLIAENGLTADDLRTALDAITLAISQEKNQMKQLEDGRAFIPRDATQSLVQSLFDEYYTEKQPEMIRRADQARGARTDEVAVTDEELIGVEVEDTRGLLEKFSLTDIGWAQCVIAMGIRSLRGKHRFTPGPAAPVAITNNARVILVGDWGSGIPRARKVGAAMRNVLDEPNAQNREQHVIHLGDVYYSGWEREYRKRFLPYWPVREDEGDTITSWSLNANHDMYSGGYGYYDFLLKDPRFKRQQQSSFFSLENDHWQILGLDTGYDEHDLKGDQAEWARNKLSSTPNKKGLILSHHQLFSAYEGGGEKLAEKLDPALKASQIRAWFWGHEHRCTLYKPLHNVEYARCIGHGGIPTYASQSSLPESVLYEYQDAFDEGLESWALFGFAVLDFSDDRIHVRYINENGTEHRTETLTKQ